MTYKEWKEARQKEANDLPLKFAFSNEQFKKMMEEWGLTEDDTDKIYSLGFGGGYYLRKDAELIRAYFSKPCDIKKLMRDEAFALEAFEYEMWNHEYIINWQGDWDVCNCFSSKELEYSSEKTFEDYLLEAKYPKYVIKYYIKAKQNYMEKAKECC